MPSYPAPMHNDDEDTRPLIDFGIRHMSEDDWKLVRKPGLAQEALVHWLAARANEAGGGTRIVEYLAPHGLPALKLMEQHLDKEAWERVANGYPSEGHTHPLMEATKTGSLAWIKWLAKQGANLEWRDHEGNNLVGRLFDVDPLLWRIDSLPIGKRSSNTVNNKIKQWFVQQDLIEAWLKKEAPTQLWEQRNLAGMSMAQRLQGRLRNTQQKLWGKTVEIDSLLLKKAATPPKTGHPTPRL